MAKKPTYKELEQEVKKLRKEAVKLERAWDVLKESESRLSYLLTSSPAVIFTCTPVGDYPATFITKNVKAQLGYEPNEFVENPKFWADHLHPEDRRHVFADLPQVFEDGHYTHEYRFQKKDGTYRWMHEELQLLRDGEGNPMEIVGYWIDVTKRKQAEDAVRKREAELEAQSHHLKEVNATLKVLLKQREDDKKDVEENVLSNVKQLVTPHLERLNKSRLNTDQRALVGILESNLNNIVSPFVGKLSSKFLALTPMEIRVADLVKEGKTNKDIAELLPVSKNTVLYHRYNIRTKLGLRNRKINLRSYLLSLAK
jgi:PAS domain S-box-containing protein